MLSLTIRLKTVEDILDFVKRCTKLKCEADLVAGRYMVDAKSVLGVFSLDISRPLKLLVYTDDSKTVYDIMNQYVE